MAQACTVSHAENKRSLPAWMLKASSVNETPKTEDQNKQALESNVKIGLVDPTNPIKRKTGRRFKNVDSDGACELVGLQRCEGQKARRKSKGAVQDEVEEIRDVMIKKGRKASEGAAPNNNKKRKLENIKSEASSPVSIGDDIELTVEDLVSIAKEYVNADKQKQHELEAKKTARCKEHSPCPTIFTEADTGISVVNAPSMKELLQCTTATRNTRSSEHIGDESKSHQELKCPSSFLTTEDVAQDMLNLFLGPLWSKPAGYAKKSEPIESITRPTNNHAPEETDWHSGVPTQEEPVKKSIPPATTNLVPEEKDWRSELPKLGEPVTKKKSSLRDKVALFL
ncbi:hypothetical protein GQ55_9G208700 [Panicum hallii var. hallii]|uniref:Uncharacterized protein n=1 Tax=Panicum hallii var. hallii TaxID=1504633 RepID=A0A2T7C5G7_9POAL|nr:hypothetical protein GQ55_9G208700 [Panicum hallii var. hallii]